MPSSLVLLAIMSVLTILIVMAIALSRAVYTKSKIAFALVSLGLLLWQITIYTADQVHTDIRFWNQLTFLGPSLAIFGFFIFAGYLRSIPLIPRKWLSATGALTMFALSSFAVQLVAILSGRIFSSVTYNPATSSYEFVRGVFYVVYIGSFLVALAAALIRLATGYVMAPDDSQQKNALRTVSLTVALATVWGFFTNIIIPVLTNSQQYISLGQITVLIIAVGFALSIGRYRFLNIRPSIFRAVLYMLSLPLAIGMYVGVAVMIGSLILGESVRSNTVLLLALLTLAGMLTYQPLRRKYDHLTNRLFFRDYYDTQQFLSQLNNVALANTDLHDLLMNSSRVIDENLKCEFSLFDLPETDHQHRRVIGSKLFELSESDSMIIQNALAKDASHILIFDEKDTKRRGISEVLRKNDIALVIGLGTESQIDSMDVRYLVLGPKKSGNPYTKQDLKIIGVVSSELTIAIQNALRFEEIERFSETLQEKVEQATRKLQKANEKLVKMDETKDEFISMASHQLRTPLTSVKGYVSMVLEGDAGPLTDMQRKLLDQAFISSQRMVYLIADLLNVSRLRTGKFVIEPSSVNLADVIESEVTQLQGSAKDRNLTLSYAKPKDFPLLVLDETKTRQVIMNFMDNAIYYTPQGGHIHVALTETEKMIEFTVTDDGIGIPRPDQPHLFTKFYRANNARKARPDGTGLGLYMAKKVIVAQGGAVIFRSKEGKGSTFGFTFAKAKLPPVTAPATQDAGVSAAAPVM